MSRTIIFSQHFPSYHPKAGKPTFFVEKIWAHLADTDPYFKIPDYCTQWDWDQYYSCLWTKKHTIRKGKRWKAGDTFSPRIWSGKAYRSPQIKLGPDMEFARVIDFEMDLNGVYSLDGKYLDNRLYKQLANNDGLSETDLFHWLMPDYSKPEAFSGQILVWSLQRLPY